MPERKLQDSDEKIRGQDHTKELLSITTEWVKMLGSSARVMASSRERAPVALLPKPLTFTERPRLSREVD